MAQQMVDYDLNDYDSAIDEYYEEQEEDEEDDEDDDYWFTGEITILNSWMSILYTH